MGRRRTSAQIQRQATLVLARETYYRSRPASTVTTVQRREIDSVVYASQLLKSVTASSLFKVPASKKATLFFGGLTSLGLRTPQSVTDPVASKPRNFRPAQVHAMVGATTPTARVTAWGSRVIRYSPPTSGTAQAHYSAPISGTNPVVTYDAVDQRSSTIFNAIRGTLGDLDYARFWLSVEDFNNNKN